MAKAKERLKSTVKKSLRSIIFSRPSRNFVGWTKRLILPGFGRVPLFDVADFFFTGIQRGSVNSRASSLAFSFFLALFPAIIFFFTLIPYIPIPHFQDQLLELIKNILPTNAYEATRDTIEDIVKHQRGGLLSLGFILAIYFTSNGFNAMMEGFNRSYHITETRSPWRQRLVAIILTFIISLLVFVATALVVFSEIGLKLLVKHHWIKSKTTITFLLFGKWIVVMALIFFAISFLYYYGPAVHKRWKFFSAGSTFATILTVLASIGFAYFVNHFGQYNKLYGSIGTVIIVLLWIYYSSLILIIGFELNASIDRGKKKVIKN